jgi:hypothetical protein
MHYVLMFLQLVVASRVPPALSAMLSLCCYTGGMFQLEAQGGLLEVAWRGLRVSWGSGVSYRVFGISAEVSSRFQTKLQGVLRVLGALLDFRGDFYKCLSSQACWEVGGVQEKRWFISTAIGTHPNGTEILQPESVLCWEDGTLHESHPQLSVEQFIANYKHVKEFNNEIKIGRKVLRSLVDSGKVQMDRIQDWNKSEVRTRQAMGMRLKLEYAVVQVDHFAAHFQAPVEAVEKEAKLKTVTMRTTEATEVSCVLMELTSARAAGIPHMTLEAYFEAENMFAEEILGHHETLHAQHGSNVFSWLCKETLRDRPSQIRVRECPNLPSYKEIAEKVSNYQQRLQLQEAESETTEGIEADAPATAPDSSMRSASRLTSGRSMLPPAVIAKSKAKGKAKARAKHDAGPASAGGGRRKGESLLGGSAAAPSLMGSVAGSVASIAGGAGGNAAGSTVLLNVARDAGGSGLGVSIEQILGGFQPGREVNGVPLLFYIRFFVVLMSTIEGFSLFGRLGVPQILHWWLLPLLGPQHPPGLADR